MNRVIDFWTHSWENRYLIFQLTKRNVTSRHKRSKLGMFWSLAEPLAYMGVLYLVFGLGLRTGAKMDIPFICYLATGLAAMNYFSEVFGKGTNAIKGHSYILNKVNIKPSILPVVTVFTGIVHHLLFLIPVLLILLLNGFYPNWYWLQVIYYMFALSVFLLGLTWFSASVGVFFNDLQSLVSIVSRLVFYLTPVFWNYKSVSPKMLALVKFNPLFYIAMGYRDSFFYEVPFWEHSKQTLYFWTWTLAMIILGAYTFKKLRPQFADML